MNVKIVNHGKAFGNENWYTFYCPGCGKQVTRGETEGVNHGCGTEIVWPERDNK